MKGEGAAWGEVFERPGVLRGGAANEFDSSASRRAAEHRAVRCRERGGGQGFFALLDRSSDRPRYGAQVKNTRGPRPTPGPPKIITSRESATPRENPRASTTPTPPSR